MGVLSIIMSQDVCNEHTLFCPVYVLDSRLQSGIGGIPKWNPRSSAGVYLGHSPDHASNVALVLNLDMGLVSPQYHVVFDDDFSTVDFLRSGKEPSNWSDLCKFHTEDYRMNVLPEEKTLNDLRNELELDLPLNQESQHSLPDHDSSTSHQTPSVESKPLSSASSASSHVSASEGEDFTDFDFGSSVSENNTSNQSLADSFTNQSVNDATLPMSTDPGSSRPPPAPDPSIQPENKDPPLRRSSRTRRGVNRLTASKLGNLVGKSMLAALGFVTAYISTTSTGSIGCYSSFKSSFNHTLASHHAKIMHYDEAVQLNIDGSMNYIHPLSFAAKKTGNEVFYFHQAMQEDDREDFIKAMIKELEDHRVNKHWKLVKRSTIGDAPTIKAIWSFKRKRRPDGSLLKHKARLCAHGGMQVHGENFWDTYAPVVLWVCILRMLVLCSVLDVSSLDKSYVLMQIKDTPHKQI